MLGDSYDAFVVLDQPVLPSHEMRRALDFGNRHTSNAHAHERGDTSELRISATGTGCWVLRLVAFIIYRVTNDPFASESTNLG